MPTDHAFVVVYVLKTALAPAARKAAGEAAVARAATETVLMSGWSEYYIQRSARPPEVLRATDFKSQVAELVEHTRDTLAYFRKLAYLPEEGAPLPL